MKRVHSPANLLPMLIIFLSLSLSSACGEEPAPSEATALPPTATDPAPTATATPAPTETIPADTTETRAGSDPRVPYSSATAGITLFHPPTWTAELAAGAGMVLVAPEVAAQMRDISNALIIAGPSSMVGQSIVAGEESLTEEQAEAAFQFMLPNFALPFVPDMAMAEEITIVEEGRTSRATVPYSGTTVQEIPVSGTLSLIVDGQQVGGVLTLNTGDETVAAVLAEILGSIALSAPIPQ